MAETDGRFEDEGWRMRKDGSRFWANVVITALRDDDGALIGFSKITRDLTERKQDEAGWPKARSAPPARQGIMDYAILMLDDDGRRHELEQRRGSDHGYAAAEMLGKHFSRFYTPEDIHGTKPWQQLREAHEQGRASDEELARPQGRQRSFGRAP